VLRGAARDAPRLWRPPGLVLGDCEERLGMLDQGTGMGWECWTGSKGLAGDTGAGW